MAALSLKWVPVLLALIVAMISGAAYMIFRDPESGRLMEEFAQEAASEIREASKVRAPALTDAQFAEHAVRVGLYTSIYEAFRRVLGGPAPGESVAEVAQAYRSGAVGLEGILEYVSGKEKDYWMRRAGVEAFSLSEKTAAEPEPEQRLTIAEHIWAIGEALGRSIPFDALRSAEAAVAEGFVNMQTIYECVNNARQSISRPLEAFEGGDPPQAPEEQQGPEGQQAQEGQEAPEGQPEEKPRKAPATFTKPDGTFDLAAFNAMVDATTGSKAPTPPPASASVPIADAARSPEPDRFRRPDGTFDLAGFNAASGGSSAASAKAEMAAKTLAASEEERNSDDRRLADGGRGGAPSPDDFRKQDGTFDTAAFNADFMKRVADGKASRAGSEDAFGMKNGAGGVSRDGPGITPLGGRERDDGPSARTGSSAEAEEYMRKIVAAEGRAEAREPYRVFPFPHAPSFVANRFADDNERLGDRVSALYRTVFGTPPDRTTRKFLTGRLRAWSGDMRRLSNLVSTMHTMASAQAVKTKSARDASVGEVVRALESGASEEEARERASAKAAADAAEKDGRVAVETDVASAGGNVAISEVVSVSGKLLSYLERDGVPPERAERDVATAIADWMESQLAIASADAVPRSTTDVYLDSRDLGMLVKSRQFQDPVEAL